MTGDTNTVKDPGGAGPRTSLESTPKRAALLVIHGIGEQDPLQALDSFTQGLAKQWQIAPGSMEHKLLKFGDRTRTAVRIPLKAPLGRSGASELDVMEFYWAHMVQGRITLRQVLNWLIRTSMTPLRSWAVNAAILDRGNASTLRRTWIQCREIVRFVIMFGIAAGLTSLFVYAGSQWETLASAGGDLLEVLGGIDRPVWFASFLLVVIVILGLLKGWWQFARNCWKGAIQENSITAPWRHFSFIAFLLLSAIAWWMHQAFALGVPALVRELRVVISPSTVLAALIAIAAVAVLRPILIKYLGDVTLYVTADKKSSFYRTRAEILKAATQQLQDLLGSDRYSAVYIAGHSLGSVIAYDTLNRIMRKVRADQELDPNKGKLDLAKLRGLLTFGSPLDKVYYFFREEARGDEAVRGQILSSLHGFRKLSSGREYRSMKFARYTIPKPDDFHWTNVYATLDVVSANLEFYDLDFQIHRPYLNPITAHTAYWKDDEFYNIVTGWL